MDARKKFLLPAGFITNFKADIYSMPNFHFLKRVEAKIINYRIFAPQIHCSSTFIKTFCLHM